MAKYYHSAPYSVTPYLRRKAKERRTAHEMAEGHAADAPTPGVQCCQRPKVLSMTFDLRATMGMLCLPPTAFSISLAHYNSPISGWKCSPGSRSCEMCLGRCLVSFKLVLRSPVGGFWGDLLAQLFQHLTRNIPSSLILVLMVSDFEVSADLKMLSKCSKMV